MYEIYHVALIKRKWALNSAFMFCREQRAVIVNHFLGDKLLCATTDELIESYASQGEGMVQQQKMLDMICSVFVKWVFSENAQKNSSTLPTFSAEE